MDSYFIGFSTSGHDPAFAIVNANGELVFAESTERFVQQKRAWGIDSDHPEHIRYVLPHIIDGPANFVFSQSWMRSKTNSYLDVKGGYIFDDNDIKWMVRLQDKAFQEAGTNFKHLVKNSKAIVHNFDHHLCHAVNACGSFGKENALCVVIDGEGEVGSVSIYRLRNRELKRLTRSWGPGSLGSFYGFLTKLCGFDWRKGEEWKVMGLAAFGTVNNDLVAQFSSMLSINRGKVYFSEASGQELIDKYATAGSSNYLEMADVAASGQHAYTYFVNEILSYCRQFEEENLILGGGCALNSSFNGSLIGNSSFKNIHVPCAPADDGNAVGAALLAWMEANSTSRIPHTGCSPYLGSDITWDLKAMESIKKASSLKITDLGSNSANAVAEYLFAGKVVGVMRGRAEFGPRALGNRSILASPLPKEMKDHINHAIKGREAYRPFAPIVQEVAVSDFFERGGLSPYMSFTLPWKANMLDIVPAVVHEDFTGRLQTVNNNQNPWLNELLVSFGKLSGTPIVLNTSFNVMGKPIVHSLDDALVVLMTTGLDAVLYDTLLIEK